jgi:hypothetical protein
MGVLIVAMAVILGILLQDIAFDLPIFLAPSPSALARFRSYQIGMMIEPYHITHAAVAVCILIFVWTAVTRVVLHGSRSLFDLLLFVGTLVGAPAFVFITIPAEQAVTKGSVAEVGDILRMDFAVAYDEAIQLARTVGYTHFAMLGFTVLGLILHALNGSQAKSTGKDKAK